MIQVHSGKWPPQVLSLTGAYRYDSKLVSHTEVKLKRIEDEADDAVNCCVVYNVSHELQKSFIMKKVLCETNLNALFMDLIRCEFFLFDSLQNHHQSEMIYVY